MENEDKNTLDITQLQANFDKLEKDVEKYKEIAKNQELRAKKAEAKLKQGNETEISMEDYDEMKQKLSIATQKNTEYEEKAIKYNNIKKKSDIAMAISRNNSIKPDLLDIIEYGLDSRTMVKDGITVGKTSEGTVRYSAKTSLPMTVDEILEDMLNEKKSLMRAKTNGGLDADGNKEGNTSSLSMTEYESLNSSERAKYRQSLTKEEKEEFFKESEEL